MNISERIKYLRKEELKMTREAFAERLGTNASTIANIEYDRLKKPEQKEPLYRLICKEFKVSYIWLTEGMEPMYEELDSDSMSQIDDIMAGENEFAKNLFKEFAKLDEDEWKLLEKLIKTCHAGSCNEIFLRQQLQYSIGEHCFCFCSVKCFADNICGRKQPLYIIFIGHTDSVCL